MAWRLSAIFANVSACMPTFYVPRMKRRTLPMVAPRVTSVVTLLITHNLGRAHHGRRRRCLGGRRAASRWHDATLGGPHVACGGPSSIFGFGGMRPVVLCTNNAAR